MEEFRYWKAYIRKNGPFHWQRTDLNFAKLSAVVAASQMTKEDVEKHPEATDPKTYILEFTTPKEERRKRREKYSLKNILRTNKRMMKTLEVYAKTHRKVEDGTNRESGSTIGK